MKINRENVIANEEHRVSTAQNTLGTADDLSKNESNKMARAPSKLKDQPLAVPPVETQKVETVLTQAEEVQIWNNNPTLHWTDVVIQAEKMHIVDLEELILQKTHDLSSPSRDVSQVERENTRVS